jgi:hypothetical protein
VSPTTVRVTEAAVVAARGLALPEVTAGELAKLDGPDAVAVGDVPGSSAG